MNKNDGCLVVFLYGGTIVLSVIAGILSWKWVDPDSFWTFVGFLIRWSILSTLAHFIVMGLVSLFSQN
jgi:hypothetical protein